MISIFFNKEVAMEFIPMLAVILFFALFTLGALVAEYYYELRYLHLQAVQKLSRLFDRHRRFRDGSDGRVSS